MVRATDDRGNTQPEKRDPDRRTYFKEDVGGLVSYMAKNPLHPVVYATGHRSLGLLARVRRDLPFFRRGHELVTYQPELEERAGPRGPAASVAAPTRVIRGTDQLAPEVQLLSNGRYHVMVTNAGGGYTQRQQTALTRWRGPRESLPTRGVARDLWGGSGGRRAPSGRSRSLVVGAPRSRTAARTDARSRCGAGSP